MKPFPAPADGAALRRAIAAIEAQRDTLGDAATALALAPLHRLLTQAEAAAGAAPSLRRAQVTVLFADIVDSTTLAGRLDAEDVLQLFGRMLERAAACVRARGGRVLRYTGDGLKAGFGTDGTREDDATRAVLAGLDILAASREHAAWALREHGIEGFALRVGAHTGEVALGAGFEQDNTLTGDTVNIAARMEQAAPAGALRISAETWAHVRGRFDVSAPPPLQLKGLAVPVQTYLVERPRADALLRGTRGVEGVPTRMVGREAELAQLRAAFERLLEQRRWAAVLVVGDAGLGKTRLMLEFDHWRQQRPEPVVVMRAQATPQTEGQIYGLLRDLLARHFGIADDDSLHTARGKLERGIVPLFAEDDGPDLAEGHAHLLGHLIGIDWRDSRHIQGILDDARQLRQRALHAALQLFRRLAARQRCPLLLQLEDLHWADPESLDFLARLATESADVPLLLLGFTRPDLHERRAPGTPGWPHQRVDLAPLDAAQSDHLAAELLRRLPEVPPTLSALLTRQAEGNPYYMEELVKMLIDRGALQTGDPWRLDPERLKLTRVPTTLTGVLQARLDALPTAEKRALQQASVIGPVFWNQALAAVDEGAPALLPALVRRALAQPSGETTPDGLQAYAFHHQLLQQVTYGTVLKQDRREGHAKVARWMAGLVGLRAGDFAGTAAEHFERAGDAQNAVEFHARAAEVAVQRMAHERVLSHVERALSLLGAEQPSQAATRWRLLGAREMTLLLQGRRDAHAADLDALERLARALHDDRKRADVARRRSHLALRMGDWATAEQAARDCIAFASRAGDAEQRLGAVRLLAMAQMQQGDVAAGQALAEQALAEAREHGCRAVVGGLLNTLSMAAEKRGDVVAALDLGRQSVRAAQDLGHRTAEAVCLMNLGVAWMNLGRLDSAEHDLAAALRLLRANGDRAMESAVLGEMSTLALWRHDAARARGFANASMAIAQDVKSLEVGLYAGLALGAAELAGGCPEPARQAFGQARDRAVPIQSPWQFDACAGLCRVELAAGDTAAALATVQPVLDHVAGGGTLDGTCDVRSVELACHQALRCAGDARAGDWLERAHAGLMAQAAAITDDALRASFLECVPHHRELVRLAGAGSAGRSQELHA